MEIHVSALYTCGETVAPPDWYTGQRPTPYRLYYILGGKASYFIGDEETELTPGCFYLFPSSLPFTVRQNAEDRLNHLYFDFMTAPSIVSSRPLSCKLTDHKTLAPLLELLRHAVKEYRYENRAELRHTVIRSLEALLSLFCEITTQDISLSPDILRALEYIEQSYSEDISVRGIAERVHLDEDYFIRKFKRALGITPYAYIRNLRLSVARALRFDGESLASASAKTGFKYPSSYCRAISKPRKR